MNEYRDRSSQLTVLQTQENREQSQSNRLHDEEHSLNLENDELTNKIQELEKQKESKSQILVNLREKEQDLIATSGSSIGKLQEYDDQLKIHSESDRDLTKKINSLERQSDSLNRDLSDLIENEAKLQQILTTFGFSKDLEIFDVESIVQGLTARTKFIKCIKCKGTRNLS